MSTDTVSVWTAYKVRMREGNHSLANRRVSKRLERKHRREDEVNKRRNFSHDMEEESIPEFESAQDVFQGQSSRPKPKAGKQPKSNDRLERLKKWQEEKKKKATQDSNKNKKPVFKTGGMQRESEAVLFQSEVLQTKPGPKISKPFPFAPKSVASIVKETFSTNKNWRPEGQRLFQGNNASVKAVGKGLQKSKSVGILVQQNPSKPALKKEPKAPQAKPLRKFKSSAIVVEPSKIKQSTRQHTDLSKKLTIAAASKRNMQETSPKSLRRNKSTILKEKCNKGPTKPLVKQQKLNAMVVQVSHKKSDNNMMEANSEQGSSDSLEGGVFSDANVASPRHSTPHVLRSVIKGKSASKEERRKSKRKSKRLLSPVQGTEDCTVFKFSTDSENEVAIIVDERQKMPRRKSRHCRSTEDKKNFKSPCHASSEGKAASSLSEESTQNLVKEDRHIDDSCLIGKEKTKSSYKLISPKSEVAVRKSTRKSTRISMMKEKDVQLSSNLKTLPASSEDEDLSSSVNRLTLGKQTPYSKGQIESSNQRVRRSARKSTVRTPRMNNSQTDAVDFTSQLPEGERSALEHARTLSKKKKASEPSMTHNSNSSLVLPEYLSSPSLQGNKMFETLASQLTPSLKPPQRRSMRMLTYKEPEVIELNDSGISPRKKPCLTPLGMTKTVLSKCENGIIAQEPSPMVVDKDITPVSEQRIKMQSALAKRKSPSPFMSSGPSNNIGHLVSRSAGKSNLSDRRSTARGRRSWRSTASNLQVDEQALSDVGGKADSQHSSSVPRRTRQKSTVVSVSDEGTAVGRDLELVVSYRVERQQPVSAKASRILKELVVEKMDGETSFFEIPLDDSFQSPMKSLSGTDGPVVFEAQNENKEATKPSTPSPSVASPMTTPRSCQRARSIAPTSAFKEPGLPMSALRAQTASSRRHKTEQGTPIRSPEEMVEILKKSPMVEMSRRRPRHSSTPARLSENVSALSADKTCIGDGNHSAPLLSNNHTCCSDESLPSDSSGNTAKPQEEYFRGLIKVESNRLNTLCSKWTQLAANIPDLSDDVLGQIRSVVGKAQLLMDQRFVQFSGLVDNYAFGLGEKETTASDLQGFWEMIYFQVEDVDNLFKGLDELQSSGWQMKYPTPKAVMPKKKPIAKGVLKSKKVKSNFASFRNDMLKRKGTTTSSSSDIEVEIMM